MSDLRSKLIRLAYENPDLREDLVPLLQTRNDYGSRKASLIRELQEGDRVSHPWHGKGTVSETWTERGKPGVSIDWDSGDYSHPIEGSGMVRKLRKMGSSREAQVLMNFDGGRYDVKPPRSMYDRLSDAPFKWSTPAKNFDGSYPMPWRVADADAAKKMVMRMAKRAGVDVRDLYVDYWQEYQGHQALWIGLRNNRYKDEHRFRLRELHKELKKFTKAVMEDGWIMLVDDLKKNALR